MSVIIVGTSLFEDWPSASDSVFDIRAKSTKSWISAESVIINAGASHVVGTGTITALRPTLPNITLPATSAGLDDQTARWTVTLHRTGSKNVVATVLDGFPLPVSFEPSTTWGAIKINKQGKQPLRDTSVYTKIEVNNLLALMAGNLNRAGLASLGRIETSVAPADPLHPIAVGDNDPRIVLSGTSLQPVDAFGAGETPQGVRWTYVNPNASADSTDLVGLHTVSHFDSSLADPLFAIQTPHFDELYAWKGQNQYGGLTSAKQSFMNFDFRQICPAAGQSFIQANYMQKYGMGDAFISSDRLGLWGGANVPGDEGQSYRTMHLTHGENIVTATISSIPTPATINTTLTQNVVKSKTAQTVTVASTVGVSVGKWVTIDRGIVFVDQNTEAVKVTAVGAGTITGIFRANHNSGATVTPATVLVLSSGYQFGELRPIINRSATPVSAGTATVATLESLVVTGTGTNFTNGMVGGDATLPGYLTFLVDDFEGSTPTGGNYYHSNGTQLKVYHPISSVSSTTALNIVRRNEANTVGYRGNAVGVASNYEIWPGARMLTFDYSANPTNWSNTIVLETNTFVWAVGNTVECAFSNSPVWTGELMRMTPIVAGGAYLGGYTLENFGSCTIQSAFSANAHPSFLWPGNPAGLPSYGIGLSLYSTYTGIRLEYCKTQAMIIGVGAGISGDINWSNASGARIGYDNTEHLYINFRNNLAPDPAQQTLGILYALAGAGTLPNLRFTGNMELFNSNTGEAPFLRFKDQSGAITCQPAYPLGTAAITVPALTGTIALTDAANASYIQAAAFKVAGTQVMGARRTGWTAATGTAARTTFDTATITLEELAKRVKALLDDGIALGFIGT